MYFVKGGGGGKTKECTSNNSTLQKRSQLGLILGHEQGNQLDRNDKALKRHLFNIIDLKIL